MSVSNVYVLACINGLCHIIFGQSDGFFQGMSLREFGGDGGGECTTRAMQIVTFNLRCVIAEASCLGGIVKNIAHFIVFQMSAFDENGTSICFS